MSGGEDQTASGRTIVALARAMFATAPRLGALAVLLSLVGAVVEGLGILLLVPILGVLTRGKSSWVHDLAAQFGIATPTGLFAALIGLFIGMMIVRGLILYARDTTLQNLQARFIDAQRLRVLRALAVAPWNEVAALDHSRVTTLIGMDINRIAGSAQQLVTVSVAALTTLIQLGIVALLSPAFALVAVAALALAAVAMVIGQRRARARGRQFLIAGHKMMSNAASFLGGLKIAAAQTMRERFVTEFAASQGVARKSGLAFARDQARARLGFSLASAVALAGVLLVGVELLGVEPTRLVIVVLVFARMAGPAQGIQQGVQMIAYGLPAFEAVEALQREFGSVAESEGTPPPAGPLVLDRVTYRHPGGGGLGDASLTIPEGAIVGLTGPSGGGKTTLVDLIAGLLVPQAGTATAGGRALADGWGGAVAYVPQDGFLFHDSVRRNLDWGDAAIGEDAMHAAIETVGASAIVARMPHGLDSVVGERGALLSGGERQRLAIARALLRKPRLLILDEATNAIDQASEGDLLARLASLSPRPTILIVAHRDSSLQRCDLLVRVTDGVATVA